MMKRSSLIIAAALAAGIANVAAATPKNYALELSAAATADCGPLAALSGAENFTLQFWFNPTEWTQGAVILSRGDGFKVSLANPGTLNITIGNTTIAAGTDAAVVPTGNWTQVSVICAARQAKVYFNNNEVASNNVDAVPETNSPLVFGGGFVGRVDEVRIFDTAIPEDFERFAFNTINKWHPQWANLLVYYKFDMIGCPQVVDYKYIIDWRSAKDRGLSFAKEGQQNNHGTLAGGAQKVDASDNTRMPYLINAGYTANERFFDRIIPQDQYLLHNEIINLAGYSYNDGHAEEQNATHHAETTAQWLADFEGRSGVLAFDGSQQMSSAGLLSNHRDYAIEMWLYIDEWVDGAVLFARENAAKTEGISIELGKDKAGTNNSIIVRVDGNNWRYPAATLTTGAWHFVGVGSVSAATAATSCYTVVVDDKVLAPRAANHDGGTNVVYSGENAPVLFKNFKGKVDNVAIWAREQSSASMRSHSNGYVVPSITVHTDRGSIDNCDALYLFNFQENPGWDSYSNEEWFRAMRAAYEGYTQPRMIISFRQPQNESFGSGSGIIASSASRKRFAKEVAELSKAYDGVELDFEWVYGSGWNTYALLSNEIRAALRPDQTFNVSCHNVSYNYPVSEMDKVSAFTFQQYGPQDVHSRYSHFESMCKAFVNYGFPKEKIMSSYATTTANGSNGSPIKGIKDGFVDDDTYQLTDADIEYHEVNGEKFAFNGPYQTYKRAKYTRQNNLGGIFYWDMGNDYWVSEQQMGKYNLAKYCSYGLNSNIDPLVASVEVIHSTVGVDNVAADMGARTLEVKINGSAVEFSAPASVYTVSGACVAAEVRGIELPAGVYVARGSNSSVKFIVK